VQVRVMERGMALSRLLADADVDGAAPGADPFIGGITANSDEVERGFLFVAVQGTSRDGHDFVQEAVSRGAAAIVAEREMAGLGVPTVRVADGRMALGKLASAWYRFPASEIQMVGITGTLGKTSVLAMLEAAMHASGMPIGTIGSLGIHAPGGERDTGHTVPGAPVVQAALRELVDHGFGSAAMEVTSHALDQERVHGITYDLGIFTNLVPLEHAEYHGTFADYVRVKRRFFDHLAPDAPVVFDWSDRSVRGLVRAEGVRGIGCGSSSRARVRTGVAAVSHEGTRLLLEIRRPFEGLHGTVGPLRLPLELRLLGESNVSNAALAAAAALCLGADPSAIARALRDIEPTPRRMQIIHRGRFTVVDDTTGHPDSVSAVFQVAERLEPRAVHTVFCIRGQRGTRINRRLAEALAIWSVHVPLRTLVVTTSDDGADERNRVTRREREAFVSALAGRGIPFVEESRMEAAVRSVVEAARDGDLVLLLGAQGMDGAAGVALDVLRA
jgi:UDP-N-acetylmuramoyl-L-alanyl-D-glutamate--2,6-diaminopimelate ligase